MSEFDTICAISTSLSGSAVNIIRVSGENSIEIVNRIFKGANLLKKPPNTITHGYILDENKEPIDEVLVSIFKAPKSYTKENIVEINTHGGIYVTTKVLERVIEAGARLAENGEFTKRAFLNGRIDLSQAEAVMDMIKSSTKASLELSNKVLRGDVRELITHLRKDIEDILLHITVNIDYPEYIDEIQMTNDLCIKNCKNLIEKITKIVEKAESLRVYKEGLKTVILGKPNVGKSSLLNKLLNENKAIVTDISGTTRDIVEGDINIGGIVLHLIDTAGIRETNDPIERIGITKSKEKLDEAELVLLVLDQSQKLDNEDKDLLKLTDNKNRIILANKSDLDKKIDFTDDIISISTINGDGIEELENKIKNMFIKEEIKSSNELVISSSRHISILKKVLLSLKSALNSSIDGEYLDMIEIDLREAYNLLGEITGDTNNDSLIDELFKKFCLGK